MNRILSQSSDKTTASAGSSIDRRFRAARGACFPAGQWAVDYRDHIDAPCLYGVDNVVPVAKNALVELIAVGLEG